jgi:hypothetical protein
MAAPVNYRSYEKHVRTIGSLTVNDFVESKAESAVVAAKEKW